MIPVIYIILFFLGPMYDRSNPILWTLYVSTPTVISTGALLSRVEGPRVGLGLVHTLLPTYAYGRSLSVSSCVLGGPVDVRRVHSWYQECH